MSKIKGKFAGSYDRFVKRESLLPPGLLNLVRSLEAKDILEFGCGTGTVGVGLTAEGYRVTGVDYSEDMLRKARAKARLHRADTRFLYGDITKIRLREKFDLLLCLGNTLPLLGNLADSRKLFRNCANHLKPGGSVLFQILNYDRIMRDRPLTFAVDTAPDMIRIKQYGYGKKSIDFAVTLVDTSKIPPAVKTTRNKIHPWLKKDLAGELGGAGFRRITSLGGYNRERFGLKSKDLIIIAKL